MNRPTRFRTPARLGAALPGGRAFGDRPPDHRLRQHDAAHLRVHLRAPSRIRGGRDGRSHGQVHVRRGTYRYRSGHENVRRRGACGRTNAIAAVTTRSRARTRKRRRVEKAVLYFQDRESTLAPLTPMAREAWHLPPRSCSAQPGAESSTSSRAYPRRADRVSSPRRSPRRRAPRLPAPGRTPP